MVSRRAAPARKRKLVWARMTPAISSVANVAAGTQFTESQDLLTTFRTQAGLTAGPVGLTVMRMRFSVSCAEFSTGSAAQFVLGVRVMDSQEAVAAETDATAYSPAVSDPHADWMCFEPFSAVSAVTSVSGRVEHAIDVRSMRRLDELGQTLVAVLGTVGPYGGAAATSIAISVTSSVLLALP